MLRWVALGMGLVALALLGAGVIRVVRTRHSIVQERLGRYARGSETAIAVAVPVGRRSPLGDTLDRALAGRGFAENIATQLARADLKMTVGEFLAATVILVVGGCAVGYFVFDDILLVALLGVLAFFAPRWYLTIARRRRLRNFDIQLSNTINLMVNSLRSGYSVLQAMEAVSHEMPPPISTEFGRVVREVQLGLNLEQALNNMLRRITSDDLDMMITAINVQREVGGNLAEVLDVIGHTIRERVRIKGDIRALTAYGRSAGYLITFLPLVLIGIIYIFNRDFIMLLTTDKCGWIMIGVGVLGIVLGFLIIRKIVNIEI